MVQVPTYDPDTLLPKGYMILDVDGMFFKKLQELKRLSGNVAPMILHPK